VRIRCACFTDYRQGKKESYGEGLVKKSRIFFFSFFLFVSLVGIGASFGESFVPWVFCS
jgi:hypothetical protein